MGNTAIFRTLVLFCISLCQYQSSAFSHRKIYPQRNQILRAQNAPADTGDPLFLTPLIEAGKLDEARELARVTNLTEVISFSGYLTVNAKYNSNMYFWFFPAAFNPENAPILIWLQGGPGGSSLFGLFVENGPFIIDRYNNVELRNTAWTLTHSVIYFDNPVGTGFSFTDSDDGYARNEEDVARDLYSAVTQFFTLFPEYAARDFYITGESYAGKYVPAISYKIHSENQKLPERERINFKGMAIGDGFSDPVNMLYYGDYLYSIGLLDSNEKKHFDAEQDKARTFIQQKNWTSAFETIDRLMDGDLSPYPSYFKNVTGLDFYFNFLMSTSPPEHSYYSSFVQQDFVRRSLHVGNTSYDENTKVEFYLRNDMYDSVKPWIEALLDAPEAYKVLIYSGQLDIIVANTLTDSMLKKLQWRGAELFQQAERKIWRVGAKDVAGYVKKAKNLTYVLVRNAGHMIPYDQPKWAFDMINRFTAGKPFA